MEGKQIESLLNHSNSSSSYERQRPDRMSEKTDSKAIDP